MMMILVITDDCIRSSTTLSAADGRASGQTGAGAGQVSTVCLRCKQSLVNIIR